MDGKLFFLPVRDRQNRYNPMLNRMNHDATFRERVHEFWNWFPTEAERITAAVKSENPQQNLAFFIEEVRDKIGGLAWTFGPGAVAGALSFTVTGEGEKSRQLLAQYWLEQAVEVPGWEFYGSRQPSPPESLNDVVVEVGDSRVDVGSLLVATEVDEENQVVNIKAWHDAFEHLDENGKYHILFLLLDESLGEFGTQTKLGKIEFQKTAGAKPLQELPELLIELWADNGWDETSPLETYTGYQSEPSDDFPRADTIAGYTNVPEVVVAFLDNDGALQDDPAEGSGAQFIYVSVDRGGLDDDHDPLAYRAQIEQEVANRLAGGGGYVIGGATGTDCSYVDAVIFDGHRSIAAVREAMEISHNGQYSIASFFDSGENGTAE